MLTSIVVPFVTGTHSNADTFTGSFVNGKRNGKGVYSFTSKEELNGANYNGNYVDGLRNGTGTMTFPDGSKYVGR